MGFNYLQIFKLVERFIHEISGIQDQRSMLRRFEDFAKASENPELAKHVFTILSKAPKSFLSEISRDLCATIVTAATEQLQLFRNNPQGILVNEYFEHGYRFIVVALKDQPFIINTFNNIFETLQLESPLVLHPIIEAGELKVSLSIIYFESVPESDVKRVAERLKLVLPALQKVYADFKQMNHASIELWDKLKAQNFSEAGDFIAWLGKGRIAFMGFSKFNFQETSSGKGEFTQHFGLTGCDLPVARQIQEDLLQDYKLFGGSGSQDLYGSQTFQLTKVNSLSPVHYRRRLLHFAFLLPETKEIYSFLGLWTSRAILEEASSAPIIRRKVESFFDKADLEARGHDYKAVTRAINLTPKHHLLACSVEQIKSEIQMLQEVEFGGKSQGQVRLDVAGRGAVGTFITRTENFSAELKDLLQARLEHYFGSKANQSDFYLTSLNEKTCRLYFYVPLGAEFSKEKAEQENLKILMDQLLNEILGWKGHLELLLEDRYGSGAYRIYSHYKTAFTSRYQALTSPGEAILDIELCQALSEESPVKVRIDQSSAGTDSSFGLIEPTFTIARLSQPFKLSQVLPILENLNFIVLDSETIELSIPETNQAIYLHRFSLENNLPEDFDLTHFQLVSAAAIEQVLLGKLENDSLNSLLVTANMDLAGVQSLRLLYNMLWQIRKNASRLALRASLTNNPKCALLLWRMFQIRFDPVLQLSIQERTEILERLQVDLQQELKSVQDILEDASIKNYALLIVHSLRTNFFSVTAAQAIKLHSKELPILRGTKPLYETFVYSQQIEGIHLRSSKIARGGIRWSDRREDYRTEVLGLMRVQRIKNAIVVPSGAKGGFIVKEGAKLSTNRETVIAGYKDYIRALLSLSDNIINGQVEQQPNLVIYDEPDPYLVVAADKGTAAFSDYANQVACDEYNFWLGDGFASGGSRGYSHKEFGITARGAWECAKRHFIEAGMDFNSQPFSVVGVGDMSGDVFGNGLLQSRNMKLLAAFDHRHIFIDPDPALDQALAERQRLFQLPRSSWADYDRQLISEGGAVYDRNEKEIELSPQAREKLGIPADLAGPFSAEQIINSILKAPVDLLWNGGIGTYVKASHEVDSEVNDSANDGVRVNGADLRCKIVSEGGNLGFTQAARVEYALKGGRINTDAIDNSAGVDLSDHEVNLKILFEQMIQQKVIAPDQREKLLKEIGNHVADACLAHNRNQSFVISVAESASKKSLDYFKALIRELSQRGYINRLNDGLLSDDEIEKRALKRIGLTRPEICIFLAGMKLWIKDEILASGLAREQSVVDFGLKYFPRQIRENYKAQILEHKLFENIVTSELSNHLVDVFGITFLHRLQLSEGVDFSAALKASVAASLVLDASGLMEKIESLDTFEFRNEYREGRLDLGKALRVLATQFVHRFSSKLEIDKCIELYKSASLNLLKQGQDSFGEGVIKDNFKALLQNRLQKGLGEELSNVLSFCHLSWLMLDAADLARNKGLTESQAHALLVDIWEELGIDFLILGKLTVVAQNIWEHELLLSTYDRLRASVAKIAASIFDKSGSSDANLSALQVRKILAASHKAATLDLIVAEFKNSPNLSILHALARHLDNFSLEQR